MLPALLSLAAALAADAPTSVEGSAPSGRAFLVIPSLGYNTDEGLGLGGHAELVAREPGYAPYHWKLVAQGYASLQGYQNHCLSWDQVGLGTRHRGRLALSAAWRRWLRAGYYGLGNGARTELGAPSRRDAYDLLQPGARLALRHGLDGEGRWWAWGALELRWTRVEVYPGSVLEEERPYGVEGGLGIELSLGIQLDARDDEVDPHAGGLLELAARGAPRLGGEAGGYAGLFGSARGYRGLGARLVLAGRAMAEWLGGSVPFYEMDRWAGWRPVLGMGGSASLRGVPTGRWHGPGKAVLGSELRWTPVQLHLREHLLQGQLAPFSEAGAVWGAGDEARDPAPAPPLHPALGLGGRLVADDTFVGRLDLGWAPDPAWEEDDSAGQRWRMGAYLVFDYPY